MAEALVREREHRRRVVQADGVSEPGPGGEDEPEEAGVAATEIEHTVDAGGEVLEELSFAVLAGFEAPDAAHVLADFVLVAPR